MSKKISDIKTDLPMSMTMSAFFGISWYIGVEINTSLFLLFKRRRGLYFWSCFLVCWGVILQPLFILLADFGLWTNLKGSITMIYMTWLILVVPQSWILYSRLHLVLHDRKILRRVMAALLFNSLVFSIPTIVIGILSQVKRTDPRLVHINMIWDRLQVTVFFAQETVLSILYIYYTGRFLRNWSPLLVKKPSPSSSSSSSSIRSSENLILYHLIYTNLLVIALDIALLGIEYADLFYVQGAFKPCIYGVKLKVEFLVLNRLIKSVRRNGNGEAAGLRNDSTDIGLPKPAASSWLSRLRSRPGIDGEEEVGQQQQSIGLERMERTGKDFARSRSQESQAPILNKLRSGGDGSLQGSAIGKQGNRSMFRPSS